MRTPAFLAATWCVLTLLGGCASKPAVAPSAPPVDAAAPAPAPVPSVAPQDAISYLGGDGSSIDKAVLIRDARNEAAGVQAERVWINAHYPDFFKVQQALIVQGGRRYDSITTRSAAGESKVFYFDITEFFGKFR